MKNFEFKQKGVVLLLLLLVFLVGGSAMMLGTLNNRQDAYVQQQAELSNQMQQAKEALLAFAANSSAIYGNRGPGFFPCPETMDPTTGIADENCSSSVYLGHLPKYIEVPSGNKIFFNSYYAGINQQFWYAVAPHYIYSTDADDRRAVNRTSTDITISASRLRLDDTGNIVALIIAPGEALSSQDRDANHLAGNFLEGGNEDMDSDFFTTDAANPDLFNDRIIAITHDELMTYIGTNVAAEIKGLLDEYYDDQPESQRYPADRSEFIIALTDHDWLNHTESNNEQWVSNTTYTPISGTKASLTFGGCEAMTFTLEREVGVTRDGSTC